ncbi:hypothetical protein GS429_03395 [Natronorubrum sp. JWXQ-INN-674]|uniref:DUF7344 domain-containing protein n=1 Tax=Natronorubrum halalkaliphilum TaxID=2691917 RepID=A0A6B0VHT0_9EURY|nr:hypothetical protein [Natronorubrum halalkaliphilum]MXV61118.1 hypothetical protein [Natronorubrum halalkaliphilum]
MTLADLADEVAIREHKSPITEISAKTVQRVYLSLYHTHVPMLEEADFVRYDQEADIVTLSERVDEMERHQELLIAE